MDKSKDYKTNIEPKIFITYLFLIFLFVLVFTITFLITQYIEKQNVINDIMNNYIKNNGVFQGSIEEAKQEAESVFKAWSFSTYFGGLSTVLIFFVFVLFGRQKIKYPLRIYY